MGPAAFSIIGPMLVVLAFALAFIVANYQLAGLVSVFTAQNVDRTVWGFQIPTSWFLAMNPLAIMILTPILARWWRRRPVDALESGPARKFTFGFLLVSASFLLLRCAAIQAQEGGLADPAWIVAWVLVMTLGELLIGPVGTASISRLAPAHRQAIAMGALSAALGTGGWLSGKVGAAAAQFDSQTIYAAISGGALACAIAAWLLRGWLQRRGA